MQLEPLAYFVTTHPLSPLHVTNHFAKNTSPGASGDTYGLVAKVLFFVSLHDSKTASQDERSNQATPVC